MAVAQCRSAFGTIDATDDAEWHGKEQSQQSAERCRGDQHHGRSPPMGPHCAAVIIQTFNAYLSPLSRHVFVKSGSLEAPCSEVCSAARVFGSSCSGLPIARFCQTFYGVRALSWRSTPSLHQPAVRLGSVSGTMGQAPTASGHNSATEPIRSLIDLSLPGGRTSPDPSRVLSGEAAHRSVLSSLHAS